MKLIYLLLVLFPLQIWSQTGVNIPVEMAWGTIEKTSLDTRFRRIVAAGEWGAIILRLDEESYWLESYDRYHRTQHKKTISLNPGERFQDVIILKDRFYLLTYRLEENAGVNLLWCRQIDPKTMQQIGDAKPLADIYPDPLSGAKRSYDLVYARDSSHILLYSQVPQYDGLKRFNVKVFDASFDLQWADQIILPYTADQFQVRDYMVDPNGRLYVLGRLYDNQPEPESEEQPNYRYILLSMANSEDELLEYKIGFDNEYISDLTCRVNRMGNLVCAGFYAESSDKQVRGTMSFKVDPEARKTYDLQGTPFELSFISDAYRDSERNYGTKGSPELFQYHIRELVQRSDGGLVLIAEQFFIENTNQPGGPGIVAEPLLVENTERATDLPGLRMMGRRYNYNDIIAINITPGGKIEWARRIPKRQVSISDGGLYSGFGFAIVKDRFYFVYNDNARNFGPTADVDRRYNLNSSRASLVLTELQKDGKLQTKILADNKATGVTFRPRVSQQCSIKEWLLYGESGNKYRLLRLRL